MDWNLAVDRNRTQMLRILAALFALIGIEPGGSVDRISWSVGKIVRRFLLPAETAVRRLIYMAAHDIVVKPTIKRTSAPKSERAKAERTQKAAASEKKQRKVYFPLFDPRKRLFSEEDLIKSVSKDQAKVKSGQLPRILNLNSDSPYPWIPVDPQSENVEIILPTPEQVGLGSVALMCRRLARLKAVLDDIPYYALRLARWRARPLEDHIRRPRIVLRRGQPPGLPKRISKNNHHIIEDVQYLLKEVHLLARDMPPRPSKWDDTS